MYVPTCTVRPKLIIKWKRHIDRHVPIKKIWWTHRPSSLSAEIATLPKLFKFRLLCTPAKIYIRCVSYIRNKYLVTTITEARLVDRSGKNANFGVNDRTRGNFNRIVVSRNLEFFCWAGIVLNIQYTCIQNFCCCQYHYCLVYPS